LRVGIVLGLAGDLRDRLLLNALVLFRQILGVGRRLDVWVDALLRDALLALRLRLGRRGHGFRRLGQVQLRDLLLLFLLLLLLFRSQLRLGLLGLRLLALGAAVTLARRLLGGLRLGRWRGDLGGRRVRNLEAHLDRLRLGALHFAVAKQVSQRTQADPGRHVCPKRGENRHEHQQRFGTLEPLRYAAYRCPDAPETARRAVPSFALFIGFGSV
jgi:hypothetical protein